MEYFPRKKTLIIVLAITLLSPTLTIGFCCTHLEPSGTLYKAVGERLDLECSYVKNSIYNTSDSLFIQRCKDRKCVTIPSEITNRTSIRSSIENLQVEDSQTYTCSFKLQYNTMSMTYVWVGYRPSPPKDIYCFSKNHRDMNCTVTLADRDVWSKLDNNLTIYFQSIWSTQWLECPDYNSLYRSCYWRAPPTPGSDHDNAFVMHRGYIIRAKVVNVLGSNQADLGISDSSEIVTISALHQFKVTNITSRKAVLTWALPETLLPVTFLIDFEINYTSKWDYNKQFTYSHKSKMSTVLKHLIPHTKYDVSIRARSRLVTDERSWSPVNTLSFKTKKDAPSAAPRYTEGGYFLSRHGTNNTGDNCALQIYLKPVPRKLRNGDLSDMDYRAALEGETNTKYIFDPASTLILSHKSCWRDGPYRVIVRACMEGRLCSRKHTVIDIPSADTDLETELPRVSDVIVEGFGDTTFRVSWSTAPEVNASLINHVTVFWCRGNREQHVCQSKLSWKIIKEYVTNANIEVKHSNYRDWIFAVSLTTHNGESGGMVFDDCQFLNDKTQSEEISAVASLKPTFNLLSRSAEGNDMDTIDTVSLSFRYCDVQFLRRKPEQYEVFYKKSLSDTKENCIEGSNSLNVTASLSLQDIVLPDLDPMAQYSVCMRIRTSVGTSELSDVRWRKPLKLPVFGDGSDVKLVVGLIAAFLVVLILGFISWRLAKRYNQMDTAIEVPTVSTDHESTDEKRPTLFERKCSDEDSGFNSQYIASYSCEEKKKSEQYHTIYPQSDERFVDMDEMCGSEQSKVSGKISRNGITTKLITEPELGSRIDNSCMLSKSEKWQQCEFMNANKSGCSDSYWIASGVLCRESLNEGEGNGTFMKTGDSNKALSLTPTYLQSSKDANSRVLMDRPSYSYKRRLDNDIDLETEACINSEHSDSSILYSDLSEDDFDEIAPLENFHIDVDRQDNNGLQRMKSNQTNKKDRKNNGNSQLCSKGANPYESTSLIKSHKPCTVSLETACPGGSRYGTDANPLNMEEDNSEEEHLLAYLQSDAKVGDISSESDNDFSFTSFEPCAVNQVSGESDTRHSMKQNSPHKNHSGTCCEPHKDPSGTGCESGKDHSRTHCEPLKDKFSACFEPYKYYSDTGCEHHNHHSGSCSKPDSDQSEICYDDSAYHYDTNIEPHRNQFDTYDLSKEQSGMYRESHGQQSIVCFEPKPVHANNSRTHCEQHNPYKTLDDNKKTKVKIKGYVKKFY